MDRQIAPRKRIMVTLPEDVIDQAGEKNVDISSFVDQYGNFYAEQFLEHYGWDYLGPMDMLAIAYRCGKIREAYNEGIM
jgi:hypothetical protein